VEEEEEDEEKRRKMSGRLKRGRRRTEKD